MILSVDHLGIAVRSIAEGQRFFAALGLAVAAIEEIPSEGVRVAMIPCGGTRIELLEPTSPDSPVGRFLAKRGPGLHHVCLASDALAADEAELRAGGFQLIYPQPVHGAGGSAVQFVHPASTGGILFELAQAPPAPPK